MNFSLKVFNNNKLIQRCSTHSQRVFLKKLRSINWGETHPRVYIKVSYEKRLDNFGKLVNFDNEGVYDNKQDLWLALNAFIEND
jgi:hypothetical protein